MPLPKNPRSAKKIESAKNPHLNKNKVTGLNFEMRRDYKRLLQVVSKNYPKLTASQKSQLREMFLKTPKKDPSQILNELALFISRGK